MRYDLQPVQTTVELKTQEHVYRFITTYKGPWIGTQVLRVPTNNELWSHGVLCQRFSREDAGQWKMVHQANAPMLFSCVDEAIRALEQRGDIIVG